MNLSQTSKIDCLTCLDTSSDTTSRQSLLQSKAFNPTALHNAFYKLKKNVCFKPSVQKYQYYLFENIYNFLNSYKTGTFEFTKGAEFNLCERGKIRHIVTTPVADRVPISSLCNNILVPILRRYLIYDNCASLEGRGIDMQKERLKVHLMRYYRRYKTNQGYVLQGDFSKFFDNLQHDKIIKAIAAKIPDTETIQFLKKILKMFRPDLSNLTDTEIEDIKNGTKILNSLTLHKCSKDTVKTLDISVDIGSEVSQIIGIYYPTKLDNYIKLVKSCKYYGRYMDDFYIIHPDKVFLQNLLRDIKVICKELGLHLNLKKTHITPLNKGFTFLKTKYSISSTGKIRLQLCSDTFKREKQRLLGQKRLLQTHRICLSDIYHCYKTWRGTVAKPVRDKHRKTLTKRMYCNYESIARMDRFFKNLFKEELKLCQITFQL